MPVTAALAIRYLRDMRVAWLLAVVACADPEPVTLTVMLTGLDSRVSGNGIECGTSPACDGSRGGTCQVELDKGTRVSLTVLHPACAIGSFYFTFGFSAPCETTSGRRCEFDLMADTTVTVTGVSAAE